MTEVVSRLVSPSGTPVERALVTARLVASASWLDDATGRVVTEISVIPDSAGEWSLDLTPTDLYEVSDAYYVIVEQALGSSVSHYCAVPSSGPVRLRNILINPPVSSGFTPVSDLDDLQDVNTSGVVSGDVLSYDGTLWVPSVPDAGGGVTDHGALTGLADDDHVQYLTNARGDVRYSTPASLSSAITAHQAAADPHPSYLTQGEGDGRYSLTSHVHAPPDSDNIYPLEGYGFHAASCSGIEATVQSSMSSWHSRIWVPAGKPISKVGTVLTIAGVLGVGGLNAHALYTDDGQTLLTQSPSNGALWTQTDLRVATFDDLIDEELFGRFVRLITNVDGFQSAPSSAYAVAAHSAGATLNGPDHLQRRSSFIPPFTGAFPSSINPDTLGTPTNFVLFAVLG